MAYESPICTELDFSMESIYSIPLCDDIVFYSSVTIVQIISQNVEFHLSLEISTISGGKPNDLPYIKQRSISANWDSDTNTVHEIFGFNWDKWEYNFVSQIDKNVLWGSNNTVSTFVEVRHDKGDNVFTELISISWSVFDSIMDRIFEDNFISKMDLLLYTYSVLWGGTTRFAEMEYGDGYKVPPFIGVSSNVLWNSNSDVDFVDFNIRYHNSDLKPVDHNFLWGEYWYSLLCQKMYFPPPGNILGFKINERIDFGVCKEITLISDYEPNNYCPFKHKHTGMRENYTIIPPPPLAPIIAWSYYMINTVLVKRLPDNTEIEVISVSIQTDEDSYLWDFSIVIPSEYYLNLLKPVVQNGELILKDVEININNNVWTCRIERWSESVSFGQRSWTLSGRSPSCELSSPYDAGSSYENENAIQGGQLLSSILSGTGWDVSWGFEDNSSTYSDNINPTSEWLVPAGEFSLSENTKIQAIQHVLEAIQAVVLTVPNCYTNKTLIVNPRFKSKPWDWGTQDYVETIIPNICREIGQDFISNEDINLIIVSGEPGVVVKGTKAGTDGSKLGELFTHKLITSVQAGSEACKNLMSKEGKWFERTFTFFSMDDGVTPTDLVPSLLLPTQMIRYTDGATTWRGKVTSVSIEAGMGSNGVEVYQSINVLNYIG